MDLTWLNPPKYILKTMGFHMMLSHWTNNQRIGWREKLEETLVFSTTNRCFLRFPAVFPLNQYWDSRFFSSGGLINGLQTKKRISKECWARSHQHHHCGPIDTRIYQPQHFTLRATSATAVNLAPYFHGNWKHVFACQSCLHIKT